MRARRAGPSDAAGIHELIAHYAAQGLLLPRAKEEIRRNIGHFLVQVEKGRLISCVAIESYTTDLAEIRSLAVDPAILGRGVGAKLVEFALADARRREIAKVFAVTHAPEFFIRQGFTEVPRKSLTEKVERDCRTCSKRRSCKLVAVTITLLPEREMLPILGESATPLPAA